MKVLILLFTICGSLQALAVKHVLALDPGSLLGFMQASMLERFENLTKKSISEQFDIIGGTSTGAVIASLLAVKNDEGAPLHSAASVRGMYEELGASLLSSKKTYSPQELLTKYNVSFEDSDLPAEDREFLNDHLDEFTKVVHDEIVFKKMLEMHIGTETLVSELKPPLAIFALCRIGTLRELFLHHLSQKANDQIAFSYAHFESELHDLLQTQQQTWHDSTQLLREHLDYVVQKNTAFMHTIGYSPMVFRSTQNKRVNVVDAVLASSSLPKMFLPHQLEYDGEAISCIDGHCEHHSTVWETVKIAKEMWPKEELVVYTLGTGLRLLDKIYIDRLKEDPAIKQVFVLKPPFDEYSPFLVTTEECLLDDSEEETFEFNAPSGYGFIDGEISDRYYQITRMKKTVDAFMLTQEFGAAVNWLRDRLTRID